MSASAEPAPLGAQSQRRVRKILSLDGGGVRGLSEILILQSIMSLLSFERRVDVEPWQEFDMICGTSTGGILAILLGRLKLTVAEAQSAYLGLSKNIFARKHHTLNPTRAYDKLKANGKFESEPLNEQTRALLEERGLTNDELLRDPDKDGCKVFVCAVREADTSAPAVIRSYRSRRPDTLSDNVKIWEAARATSAVSTFFDPVEIGPFKQKYVDGALGWNNPIDLAEFESRDLWPDDDRIFISLGTGSVPGQGVEGNLVDLARRLAKIVTEADMTNDRFRRTHSKLVDDNRLFRFTVTQGLGNIGLEEYQAINKIAAYTETYMQNSDVFKLLEACVRSMKDAGQRLNIAGPHEYEDLLAYQARDVMTKICSTCLKGQSVGSTLFMCRTCNVWECIVCKVYHDKKHQSSMLRFTPLQWNQSMEHDLVKSCSLCSRLVRSRFECTQCAKALCDICCDIVSTNDAWFEEHDPTHKSFRSIVPPNFAIGPPMTRSCTCVGDGNVMMHCSRCLNALKAGSTLHWCITCRNIYGAAVRSCSKCHREELPKHNGHKFQTILLVRKEPSAATPRRSTAAEQFGECWQCFDCDSIIHWSNFARHPCPTMGFVAGNAMLDAIRFDQTKCVRLAEPKWPFEEPSYTRVQCSACKDCIPYDTWSLICPDCVSMTCKKCLKTTRENHLHNTNLCKIARTHASLRPGNGRRCQACSREHPGHDFSGIQCTNCRHWELCYNCLVNKNSARHPTCDGRMTVWELLIPKSGLNVAQGSNSRAAKIMRGVGDNPGYVLAAAMGGLLAAAALEDIIDDDD